MAPAIKQLAVLFPLICACAHVWAQGNETQRSLCRVLPVSVDSGVSLSSTCAREARDPAGILLVDIANVPPEMQAALYRALSDTFTKAAWTRSPPAQAGDSAWSIVGRQYRIAGNPIAFPRAQIQREVLVANASVSDLQVGEAILVPPIPPAPAPMADARVAEVLEFEPSGGWSHYVAQISTDPADDLVITIDDAAANQGGVWMYRNVPASILETVIANMPASMQDAMRSAVEFVPDEQTPALVLLLSDGPTAVKVLDAPPLTVQRLDEGTLATLRRNPAGRYELLDVMHALPGQCSHGKAVRHVAAQVLTDAGADFLIPGIVTRDIDFYRNPSLGVAIIKQYAKRYTEGVRANIEAIADRLARYRPPPNELRVPLLLLRALSELAMHSSSEVLVVSYSFAVRTDDFAALGSRFDEELPISFLTASLNLPSALVDGTAFRDFELLRTFSQRRREGLIVVGGIDDKGAPFGMTLQGGGVTVPGYATGWANRTACQDDSGNSFATPHIGAMLFIARVYWRNIGVLIGSAEARKRLILASAVTPTLLDHFSAPGLPDLRRLLLARGLYGVRPDGSVQPLALSTRGQLEVEPMAGSDGAIVLYPERRAFALQKIDRRYFFVDAKQDDAHWVEVEVNDLKLPLSDGRSLDETSAFQEFQGFIGVGQ